MPTSYPVRSYGLLDPRQLAYPPSYRCDMPLISPLSFQAIGDEYTAMSATNLVASANASASTVFAYPFQLNSPYLARKVWWANGTAASATDHIDVGVYTEDGATLLLHSGSTACNGTSNVLQEVDTTDTLLPVGRYWCAFIDGSTASNFVASAAPAVLWRAMGCAQQTGSGSTLGSTFTPAAYASAWLPMFGIANRTFVA